MEQKIGVRMYFSIVGHILLLIFTFGIWQLIWVYRVTDYTNCLKGEKDRYPLGKLLLYMFVPFYKIYWNYKTAQRIDVMAKTRGVISDITSVCLGVSFIIPIIAPIIIQDKLNFIALSEPKNSSSSQTSSFENLNIIEKSPRHEQMSIDDQMRQTNQMKRLEEITLARGGWKCSKCGRANPDYVRVCKCGVKKEEVEGK